MGGAGEQGSLGLRVCSLRWHLSGKRLGGPGLEGGLWTAGAGTRSLDQGRRDEGRRDQGRRDQGRRDLQEETTEEAVWPQTPGYRNQESPRPVGAEPRRVWAEPVHPP